MEIAVVGAGSWGTALALVLAHKGNQVSLWVRNNDLYKSMMLKRRNEHYLPHANLPPDIRPTLSLEEAVKGKKYIFLVVPSQAVRETVSRLKPHLAKSAILVNAAKGLEQDTSLRMSQVIEEELKGDNKYGVAVISGPNHAEEVSQNIPSATVVASKEPEVARKVQEILMTPYLRVYTNSDLIGVEMGGALKNIVALGSGIAEGLGMGDNTKAALLTRGLLEIIRLGKAMGAQGSTFTGLSGLGDLFVTSSSRHSRNLQVGIELGKGNSLRQIMSGMQMVAEGVNTTRVAYQLSEERGIEMPITWQIYEVLFDNKAPKDAASALMQRDKKGEVEDIALEF